MDNKVFNVNGESFEQFELTLKLLLMDQYESNIEKFDVNSYWGRIGTNVVAYRFSDKKGLILYSHIDDNLKSRGIKSIDELIVPFVKKQFTQSLRKYKLALLNDKIKIRVGIPFDLLLYSLWYWLKNFKDWDKLQLSDWDVNLDHDGSNSKGFRIYTEDWGRVNDETYSLGAIKPVYTWYRK